MAKYSLYGIAAALALLVACGESDNATGKRQAKDGRISVVNQYHRVITVEYRLSNGTIHQTELQPGELKEISGGEVVKGGSTVKFTVIGMTPTASSHRQRIPVQVTVDGNVLVKVFTFTEGGAEVEGGTALPPEN